MTGEKAKAVIPKAIWLQPWCVDCGRYSLGDDGRQWCEDDVWDECDECGLPAVKYVLATEKGE